jgi:predicted small lipoprotein YifL
MMRSVAVFLALLVGSLAGCGNSTPIAEKVPLADKVGQDCTVQFRRGDGLGAAGDLPVTLTTDSINGAEVSVSGKLLTVSAGWIVVQSAIGEHHIPHESILLVRFTNTP